MCVCVCEFLNTAGAIKGGGIGEGTGLPAGRKEGRKRANGSCCVCFAKRLEGR